MEPRQFKHHPLLVMNNFSGDGMHFKLMSAIFQNMFPSINVSKVSDTFCVIFSLSCHVFDTREFGTPNVAAGETGGNSEVCSFELRSRRTNGGIQTLVSGENFDAVDKRTTLERIMKPHTCGVSFSATSEPFLLEWVKVSRNWWKLEYPTFLGWMTSVTSCCGKIWKKISFIFRWSSPWSQLLLIHTKRAKEISKASVRSRSSLSPLHHRTQNGMVGFVWVQCCKHSCFPHGVVEDLCCPQLDNASTAHDKTFTIQTQDYPSPLVSNTKQVFITNDIFLDGTFTNDLPANGHADFTSIFSCFWCLQDRGLVGKWSRVGRRSQWSGSATGCCGKRQCKISKKRHTVSTKSDKRPLLCYCPAVSRLAVTVCERPVKVITSTCPKSDLQKCFRAALVDGPFAFWNPVCVAFVKDPTPTR